MQWAGPLRVMLDCHRRLLESEADRPRFPVAGDHVGEFRLLAELGLPAVYVPPRKAPLKT